MINSERDMPSTANELISLIFHYTFTIIVVAWVVRWAWDAVRDIWK